MVRIPAQRRREGAIPRQTGARPRRLWHRVAAHLIGGGGPKRGGRLPLSAPQKRAHVRAGRHPRRRADYRRALLGLSQQDYYARADVWPLNPHGEVLSS
jgi:hypothetical protein